MRKIKIITTVGTSFLTNYMDEKVRRKIKYHTSIRDIYFRDMERDDLELKGENTKLSVWIKNIYESTRESYIKGVVKSGSEWQTKEGVFNIDCSAEIRSIYEIIKKYENENGIGKNEYYIELIASDTNLSKVCAGIIDLIIEGQLKYECTGKIKYEKKEPGNYQRITKIEGLQPYNAKMFETTGMNNLIDSIYRMLYKYNNEDLSKRNDEYEYVLNITGGYKGVIPYITVLAQLENIPLYYTYEGTEKLIEIESFPMTFDWRFAEEYFLYIRDKIVTSLYNISDIEEKESVISKLVKYKFIEPDEQGVYKRTVLGDIYYYYVNSATVLGNASWGKYLELKVFQFYQEKRYRNYDELVFNIKIRTVEAFQSQSIKIGLKPVYDTLTNVMKAQEQEYDLIMIDDEKSKFVIVECKQVSAFDDTKIKETIRNFGNQIEKVMPAPEEFHYWVCTPKTIEIDNDENQIVRNIKELYMAKGRINSNMRLITYIYQYDISKGYRTAFDKGIYFQDSIKKDKVRNKNLWMYELIDNRFIELDMDGNIRGNQKEGDE